MLSHSTTMLQSNTTMEKDSRGIQFGKGSGGMSDTRDVFECFERCPYDLLQEWWGRHLNAISSRC
jgi:hypothetical protein